MFDKLTRTFSDVLRQVSGKSSISEKNIQDAVEEIKIALLEADVNLRVVRRFVNHTIEEARGEKVLRSVNPGQQFIKIVHDRMVNLLGSETEGLQLKGPDTLSPILFMGLQGSGKTTTCAKLALRLKKEGRKPLLVAADLVRPAAVKQLQLLGEQTGVPVFAVEGEKKPVKVVKQALSFAKKNSFNTMIVDTSGRMHLDDDLMKEIQEINSVLKPVEGLLVADAMTGQQAVEIAKEFNERVGITGVILSKFDSDTRGGAALSLKSVTKKPIKYVGVGEKIDELEQFHPDRMASRILGMGDVVSLVEKAQETIQEEEAEELQKKLQSSTFTLQDYLEQFTRIKKMGSLQSLVEMIPGMKGNIDEDALNSKEMKKEEAIILSMTLQERHNHRIIGPSRRKRIASGSGTSVFDVNRLLKKFDKMRLMMKKMTKNKKLQAQMLSQFNGNI
ncbi:signal recognition particle protein [Marispirochaeta aestuarii]|uniref:Signal recognition particle protein n=1 Tax=Marispirochaeta aestuarii TaxID=1963862 RepID=A0A1Y1RU88_9SPIO|nr:signal recognition particle protein [Marispirochaeta aestuarii]ORC31864.1 signal recognition particle protein [Marispirochaeta aestuarii]